MEVLLTTLNAKFVHSSLAIRYLRSYCRNEFDINLVEYTINQHNEDIIAEIYKQEPDIISFSCYIWNIEQTLEIVKTLKKVRPELIIILGGPEVSYDSVKLMSRYPEIDYVVYGEGERTFKELLTVLKKGENCCNVNGLVYRNQEGIIKNPPRAKINNLDEIPAPYYKMDGMENKIAYFETSRGCPFNCKYCLSSTLSSLRFFSLERIKEELLKLIKAGVRQVKFVDRTFNCNLERTWEIFKFLLENKPENQDINFHFEIAADALSDEIIDWLRQVPTGYFQFEIGVQSTKPKTLELINRKMDFSRVREVVTDLLQPGNIHLHLDLIAGLPGEDYERFKESFNDVYQLRPHKLQLGFLKLLKGSEIRRQAEEYGYVYTDFAPYEVLGSKSIDYDQLLNLKMVEEVLGIFSNSHHFDYSLKFIEANFYNNDYFAFYYDLALFWEEEEYHHYPHKLETKYRILQEFYEKYCANKQEIFNEVLKFDYLLGRRRVNNLPEFFKRYRVENYKAKFMDFTGNQEKLGRYFEQLTELSSRQIRKKVQIETFGYDILKIIKEPAKDLKEDLTNILFNYHNKGGLFDKARYEKIEL